jgi:hypothetical protein
MNQFRIYDWKFGEKCSKISQLPIIPTPEQNKMFDFSKKPKHYIINKVGTPFVKFNSSESHKYLYVCKWNTQLLCDKSVHKYFVWFSP